MLTTLLYKIAANPIFLLVFLIALAKLFSFVAERLKQPPILGAIVAGILVGPSLLNIAVTESVGIKLFGDLGLMLLIFLVGLNVKIEDLKETSGMALLTTCCEVVLPLLLGYAFGMLMGLGSLVSLILGISLSVTAVEISAGILKEMNRLKDYIGKVIVEVGIFDDVTGIILISLTVILAKAHGLGLPIAGTLVMLFLKVFATFVILYFVGRPVVSFIFRYFSSMKGYSYIVAFTIVFAVAVGIAFETVGLSSVIGTFIAGVFIRYVLDEQTGIFERHQLVQDPHVGPNIYKDINTISMAVFVPLFFVEIGSLVDLHVITTGLSLIAGITLIAILGKTIGGALPFYLVRRNWKEALTVGVGLNGRGSVVFVVLSIASTIGAFNNALFSSIVIMVFIANIITPIILRYFVV